MVPSGWEKTLLKNLLCTSIKNGYSPNAVEQNTGYVVLGLGALTDHTLDTANIKNVEATERVLKTQLCHGDFLISRSNTPDKVGRSVMFRGEIPNCSYPDLMMKFRADESKVEPSYLEIYLQSPKARQYFKNCAAGSSSSMVKINKSVVEKTPILKPSLPEQRKIAKILSTWDKAIAATEKLIETSKQQKKALMQQLLTGKKRLLNPETGKVFEGTWEEVKLGDVAAMNSGGTPKSSVSEYYDGKHPWVSIADMTKHGKWISKTEKSLTDEGIANSSARLYPKGTVLYAMYASIGECSIATVELCSSQAILGIRPNSNLINIYLYYYLINLKEKIILTGQQGTQSNLNAGMVKGFTIKLPTIVEQQKIASVLTAADKEIEALEAKLAHFKQEKKALMQQLLTGKCRVNVEEMEVA
ncbi:restriction endonuclease subunit S [Vibrio sp. EA2]|uniref:restriction endonuclease subunit S n=1 Tax=Vibrio sp. EA2 TaxID=3079860 RepID=UPI00294A7BFB|nr:restriction endonuclease subunit S [Vibrio sp. EA2]MDV6253054.1 restriction endonuclease subunit S [Vibrio sp. EA2]